MDRGHTGQARKARAKLWPPSASWEGQVQIPDVLEWRRESLITAGTRVSFRSPRGLGVQITVLARDPSFLHLHFLLLPHRRINPRPLPSPVPRI